MSAAPKNSQRSVGWFLKTAFLVVTIGTILGALVAGAVFWRFSRGLPKIVTAQDYNPPLATRVYGGIRGDEFIGEFFRERRYLVPYEKIPPIVIQAFISAEDDKFFEHPGINLLSMVRAGIANFRAGHVVQGGSTITQQVAKSLLLTSERSFDRKIKEVILASRIEHNLTKQQILYLYLNQIFLGHRAYGIQAASRIYFHKDVSELSIAEAALLAGMPQAPSSYNPLKNPKSARKRQLYVLGRMYDNKYITQAQMSEASSQPLRVYGDEDLNALYAPYYIEYVRQYLFDKYGEDAVLDGGLTVTLPTSIAMSSSASRSVKNGLEAVDKRIGYRGPIKKLAEGEIEGVLREQRLKMIQEKLHYQILLPDGRLDPVESLKSAKLQSDQDLIDSEQLYQAVVIRVDDKKKTVDVMLGAVRAQIPWEKMRWARPPKEGDKSFRGPEPKVPSKILSKGDLIWVKAEVSAQGVTASLEQEPQVQGGLFSVEAQTGYVLAMQGGYDFAQSEFNRATQAMRQPGSAFKPVIYAAALEKGYTPATIIVDSPLVFGNDEEGKWKPGNFEEKFYGDTTFRQSLIHSRNITTIKIVQSIQVPYVIDYAKRLGMTDTKFPDDLSISLGSATTSLMELTQVYALFPRLGRKLNPIFIKKVVDKNGKVLEEAKPQTLPAEIKIPEAPEVQASGVPAPGSPVIGQKPPGSQIVMPSYPPPDDPDQVLDPRVAYVMGHIMREVVSFGTGHEAKNLDRVSAGKTGTTSDFVDAWYMGFTTHVVTGTWVGFDNFQKSIGPGETGARAALPIWLSFMRDTAKNYPETDFILPPGVVFANIDSTTGKLTPPNASGAIEEAFIEGTQPTDTSATTLHKPAQQSDFFKDDVE